MNHLSQYQWFGVGILGVWAFFWMLEWSAGTKSIFRYLWWFFVLLGVAFILLGK